MFGSVIAIAISLFIGVVALAAWLSVVHSVRRGFGSGRAILKELRELDAGRRPAPPVRTSAIKARPARTVAAIRPLQPFALRPAAA